ncbi:hypothetical protein [Gorillibacterium sp. CAU 1737]|uniref:hypothetical protein n=1 Tax=Gorillibacterium sp. CAU 1737 TaxID=3140362 RepID=UPI003260C7FA
MAHERTRFLIQHRESKLYLQYRLKDSGILDDIDDPWKAWGFKTASEALHIKEEFACMPPDKENYRIVKMRDKREEVEEDVQ